MDAVDADDIFFVYIVINLDDQCAVVAYSQSDVREIMSAMGDDIGTLLGVMRDGTIVAVTPSGWFDMIPISLGQ